MSQCAFDAGDVGVESVTRELDEGWCCPRRAVDRSDYCVFHGRDTFDGPEAAASAVMESLNSVPGEGLFERDLGARAFDRERKRFVGARFGTLDLSSEMIERTETHPIDLRAVRAEGLVLSDARVESDVRIDGARLGTLDATDAVVDGDVSAAGLTVEERLSLDSAVVNGGLSLRNSSFRTVVLDDAHIGGRLELNDSEVRGDLRGTECVVDGRVEYKRGTVGGRIHCPGLTLRGERRYSNTSELTFRKTTVGSHVTLEHLRSAGALLLNDLEVGGDLRMDSLELDDDLWVGAVNDESTTLGPVRVDGNFLLRDAAIGGDADLSESDDGTVRGPIVGGCIDLSGSVVEGALVCNPTLAGERFNVVRLQKTTLNDGTLANPTDGGQILYDLWRASVNDVDLGAADGSVDGYRFVETRFQGFLFGNSYPAFDRAGWWIHRVYEGGYEDLAVGTAATEAAEFADDLLLAVATFEWFAEALAAPDPVERVSESLADRFDLSAIANGDETARERALPDAFERRESHRRGLIRGFAEAYANGDPTDASDVLGDDTVRERVAVANPDSYATAGGGFDPGRSAARGDLQRAVAERIADADTERPDTDSLLTTYLLAKNGAHHVGDTNAAAQFFQKEMRCRQRKHREALRGDGSIRERARSAYDFASNALFNLSSGYGERPRRVLLFSGAAVIGFAGVFAGLLSAPPYGKPSGYLLMSLESFVALFLGGGTEHTDLLVRLTATAEGFVGAFLVALFVFTLTRSIER